MTTAPRYLTKSRFKLAVECPSKLYYAGKPDYVDRSLDDSFLAALAEGGYQVGELAVLMHPGGVRVEALDHALAAARTAELLLQDEVIIFEAALTFENLFIRVDILKKHGDECELIEVKAKSYSASEDGDFRGARGKLKSEFLPYLRDVAFQRYVTQKALPACRIRAFLMLVDKEQRTSVDGLNQRFKARKYGSRLHIEVAPGTDAAALGVPLLAKVSVDAQVDEIVNCQLITAAGAAMPFEDAVRYFAQAYVDDSRIQPTPSVQCARCQFKADHWPAQGEPKSGFHECWSSAFNWGADDFSEGTVLDLWSCPGKAQLIAKGVLKPSQVTVEDLGFDGQPPGPAGLSRKHRQWYFCRPDWPGGGDFYFDKSGMQQAMAAWTFPLHCIDFETSVVAIPFVKGRRPYETTAFQFSHHVIESGDRVSHREQWICAEPGVDPNVEFVRALKTALEADNGTIFRWAAHENTVLNQLRHQLLTDEHVPADRDGLVAFIESITTRKTDNKSSVVGARSMVDLCDLAEKFFFHPATMGSTSLKKVLPALMRSSDELRERYRSPTYGGAQVSLNFAQPVAWWQTGDDGQVIDPYLLLPPIFDDVPQIEMEALEEGLADQIQEGGTAMAAYARLQFEDLSAETRQQMRDALLRYCELDTLAMVMAIQAWTAWANG